MHQSIHRIFTFIISLSIFQIVASQNSDGIIEGYVYNSRNQPIPYSTVMLLDKDTVFVKGTLSQDNGMFQIDKIRPGDYLLMIRNVEFKTWVSDPVKLGPGESIKLKKIQLQTKVTDLDEVTVVAKKAPLEVHPDKIVFNINSNINTAGNNGLELLSKAPGVIIDLDKNIILQGKSGVRIYINGRPSRLSGDDLTSMLEGMRSENIESIEIITNPSAKYEAEGTGGIINIILKRSFKRGINGTVNGNYSIGRYPRSNVGTSLNLIKNKLNFFSSLNLSDNEYMEELNSSTLQGNFLKDMKSLSVDKRRSFNFTGGMDYKINESSSLSLDSRIQISDGTGNLSSSTKITDQTMESEPELLISKTIDDMESENYNLNLHYHHQSSETSNLSSDISYGQYSIKWETFQPNDYFSSDGENILRSINDEYDSKTDIDIISARVDYEKEIGQFQLSGGAKYSFVHSANELIYYLITNGKSSIDPERSNDFSFLEQILAAYLNMKTSLGERITFNVGLRMENTDSRGELTSEVITENDRVTRNYTSLFPNLNISYNDEEKHAVSFNFGRRITRPNYRYLNPFVAKYSEIYAWKGNPFLKPYYVTNFQLSYSYKRFLLISENFSITKDFFSNVFITVDEISSILTPLNMDKVINNSLSVSLPFKVTDWWNFYSMLVYNYEEYNADVEETQIDLSTNIIYFRIQNNLQLPWDIIMELTLTTQSPWIWRGSIEVEGYQRLGIGFKKEFLQNKLMVQLTGNDIFRTSTEFDYESDYGGMLINGTRTFDWQRFGISISYKFGDQKAGKVKRKSSAMQEELDRIDE